MAGKTVTGNRFQRTFWIMKERVLNYEGARYFESGGGNEGLEDLIVNHVEPEKEAA